MFLEGKQGSARHRRRHLIELRVQSYSRTLQGHAISCGDGVTVDLDAELDEKSQQLRRTSDTHSRLLWDRIYSTAAAAAVAWVLGVYGGARGQGVMQQNLDRRR